MPENQTAWSSNNQGIKKNSQTVKPDRCAEANRAQMKEQSKASERELSKEEIASLSDGEFKVPVIKMLTELIELC